MTREPTRHELERASRRRYGLQRSKSPGFPYFTIIVAMVLILFIAFIISSVLVYGGGPDGRY